ncbi:hypothetical protein B0H14DRAFT_2599679 [Mycena olivaceomarginata]|nr:hypothetical protein B0H14DRAFT_2599679 [Mycena olivaceomarginata]
MDIWLHTPKSAREQAKSGSEYKKLESFRDSERSEEQVWCVTRRYARQTVPKTKISVPKNEIVPEIPTNTAGQRAFPDTSTDDSRPKAGDSNTVPTIPTIQGPRPAIQYDSRPKAGDSIRFKVQDRRFKSHAQMIPDDSDISTT